MPAIGDSSRRSISTISTRKELSRPVAPVPNSGDRRAFSRRSRSLGAEVWWPFISNDREAPRLGDEPWRLAHLGRVLMLAGCDGQNGAAKSDATAPVGVVMQVRTVAPHVLSVTAQLGGELFFDPHLSASGAMACATCHDPEHAYGPANDLAVQLGGPGRVSPDCGRSPSLRYKEIHAGLRESARQPRRLQRSGAGGWLRLGWARRFSRRAGQDAACFRRSRWPTAAPSTW